MKTILIATDGSESAGQALEVAIDLARQTGAALEVLSVRPMRAAGRGGAGESCAVGCLSGGWFGSLNKSRN